MKIFRLKQAAYSNNIQYLADVLSGKLEPGQDLSSLENNVIVVTHPGSST